MNSDGVTTHPDGMVVPEHADAVAELLRSARRTSTSTADSRAPDLAEFLPDSTTLRHRWLVALISVDLQERWLRARLPTADMTGTASIRLERARPGPQDELEDLDVGDRLDDFDLLMGLGRGGEDVRFFGCSRAI